MNNVLELRNKLQMTQDEFAEHCGLSRISVARYEADAKLSVTNAEKIAKACNVSVDYVLGRDTSSEKPPFDYAAHGVAVRAIPQTSQLTENELDILTRRVQERMGASPSLSPSEQEMIDEFRQLSNTQKSRVRAMIAGYLDAKYNNE